MPQEGLIIRGVKREAGGWRVSAGRRLIARRKAMRSGGVEPRCLGRGALVDRLDELMGCRRPPVAGGFRKSRRCGDRWESTVTVTAGRLAQLDSDRGLIRGTARRPAGIGQASLPGRQV